MVTEYYKNLDLENLSTFINGKLIIERWVDISGYEGLYAISNFGRVKSYSKIRNNRNGICIKKHRILRQGNKAGYLSVGLAKYRINKSFTVHILVGNAFVDGKFENAEINHKKGNRKDNRAWELEWITHQQNIQHAFDIGLKSQIGSKCPRAILDEEKVIEIRKKFKPLVYTRKMLSDEYGISIASIKKILNRTNWAHI